MNNNLVVNEKGIYYHEIYLVLIPGNVILVDTSSFGGK